MNKIRHIILFAAALALSVNVVAAPRKNILELKNTIDDNDIVFPASFDTDTEELMRNWYLQNYAVLDADVENRSAGDTSEDTYIKRLKALPTEIEMPYNQVVRHYIDRYVKRNRTLVEEMLGMSLYYMPIFEQALEKEQMPLELKYLPVIESALNPNAVSPAGAAGLWQFMVGTGKGLGLEVNSLVDERRDPYRSSEMAAKYLKNLYSIYNDWSLAIAAYNCGPGNVNKALHRAGNDGTKDFWAIYKYLPRETRGYVPAFIAANYIMTYYKQHNISPSLARKPLITDTVTVTRRVNFNQIANVLNMPIEAIRVLNPQYRRDVIPGNTHPYRLILPSQQVYSFIMSEDSIYNYQREMYAHRDVVEPGESYGSYHTSDDEIRVVSSRDNDDMGAITYHKVQRGENAATIAEQYGMSTTDLVALNNLSTIKVERGQILKVAPRRKGGSNASPDNAPEPTALVADNNAPEDDEPDAEEQAQIEEVRQIERQAAQGSPYKGSYRVDTDNSRAQAKAKTAKREKTVTPASASDSKEWHNRNAQYANKKKESRSTSSRETTYKNSRSSKRAADSKKSKSKAKAETPAPTEKHTVQKGESLTKIAEKNGVTVDELRKANNLSGDKIKTGETIKIPGKAKASTSKKSSKASKSTSSKSSKSSKASTKSSSKTSKKSSATKSSSKSSSKTSTKKSTNSTSKKKKKK